MVTVKKSTVKTKVFEREVIKTIKLVKSLELPTQAKKDILEQLRSMHNNCLEWGEPQKDFETTW